MLFDFLYDISLHLYLIANMPKAISNWSKYKNNLWRRFGKGFPAIDKKGKKLIWIHAVSLGETKAIAPLIKRLKGVPNPPLILLSTATETGHAEGLKNVPGADFHVFLPLDISYIISPIVKRVAPDAVILMETDFWYRFQKSAKKQGAQIFVVNGKISEKSFKRFSGFPFLARRLFNSIDHFYLQGDLYRTRFEQLQIPLSQLTVTGNIKLDTEVARCDVTALKNQLGLGSEPVLTLGSTHNPEESLWLGAIKQLWKEFPSLRVLIVPRHPERFSEVVKLLQTEQIPFSRWSEKGKLDRNRVLLVDAMGVLRTCYQISTLCFVGGSFLRKVGGHNILEPSFYGKPTLFGPHMHSQPDLLSLTTTYRSGLQITPETIIPTIKTLLTNTKQRDELGNNGLMLTQAARGSLDHTFNLLQKRLPC